LINGKRERKEFTCDEDVWQIIDLLIKEAKDVNLQGKDFDVARSVYVQLPFFACRNIIYSKKYQKDIQKYIYCKDFGVSPYEGSFQKHPARWIEKSFIIKNALAKKENAQIEKVKDGSK
tara:strand:- start:8268 stop:8624 length:357 start_codon:yes stop_codon:yes gene_type:complete